MSEEEEEEEKKVGPVTSRGLDEGDCNRELEWVLNMIRKGAEAKRMIKFVEEEHPLLWGKSYGGVVELIKRTLNEEIEDYEYMTSAGGFLETMRNLNGCNTLLKELEEKRKGEEMKHFEED